MQLFSGGSCFVQKTVIVENSKWFRFFVGPSFFSGGLFCCSCFVGEGIWWCCLENIFEQCVCVSVFCVSFFLFCFFVVENWN